MKKSITFIVMMWMVSCIGDSEHHYYQELNSSAASGDTVYVAVVGSDCVKCDIILYSLHEEIEACPNAELFIVFHGRREKEIDYILTDIGLELPDERIINSSHLADSLSEANGIPRVRSALYRWGDARAAVLIGDIPRDFRPCMGAFH